VKGDITNRAKTVHRIYLVKAHTGTIFSYEMVGNVSAMIMAEWASLSNKILKSDKPTTCCCPAIGGPAINQGANIFSQTKIITPL